MDRPLCRHDLVWLDSAVDAGACVLDPAHGALARRWVGQGRPLVVARQHESTPDKDQRLSLGLTLPPPLTRRRVALSVPPEAVVRHTGPLKLAEALPHAPAWHDTMECLLLLCEVAGVTPCVYGSLSWQALTGHAYLTDTSDLDLLFVCDERVEIDRLLAALAPFRETKPRLDGEILALTGWATSWRELDAALHAGGAARVLARSTYGVRLVMVDEFLGRTTVVAA